ncbi:MAG TPA: hypothetical protein VFI10_05050 [Gaiellaceae bacterium]|jgi:hypothetical protein|nr:hypothetical protein [Gaiellaceae bacterium]
MPTRKQRRRELKAKRHEYEFVYVDADGNELDEAPPELVEQEREKKERPSAAKASANGSAKGKGSTRSRREPQPPSWNRAVKRAGMLGIVVFFLFSLSAGSSHNRYVAALIPAVIYTALFIPFTYMIDRFAYRRFQARQAAESGSGKSATQRPAKKR